MKALTAFLLFVFANFSMAQGKPSHSKWVSAWSASVHAPLPFPGLPPTPVLDNQTVRMIIRPSIGGQTVRIRFSNAEGTSALDIAAAHIALSDHNAMIRPETDHAITFDGKSSVSVPPGAPLLSDPIEMNVPTFAEVAISIYLTHSVTASTTHFWAQHDTYISGPGDFTMQSDILNPTVRPTWYWLADVEVLTVEPAGAIVTLGDSITDGVGAKQGAYEDWPDQLARRLTAGGTQMSVLNEGIGGNRVLRDGAGINALARLDRDVLAQPGVSAVILLEGINDIGWPHMQPRKPADGGAPMASPFKGQDVTAQELIAGYKQIIDRVHQHGARIFGATMTPYEGADYYSADGEAIRQTVNHWTRTSGAFDGVFDFDAAVRNPEHPSQFQTSFQSGDHLHPSAAGYAAMAKAIDLKVLNRALP